MRFRNTILAFLLLAGLTVFIYYYEYRGEEAREAQAETEGSALHFENDKVSAIEITRSQGATLHLDRQADGWMISSPLKVRADGEKVGSLLSGLGFLKVEKKLDGIQENELAEFKLADPAVRVKLTTGEPNDLTLEIGDKAPIGNEYYARKPGATEILLISGDLSQIISADAASLRYKKMVGVDTWKVARFQIEKGSAAVGFARGTGAEEWRLDQPMSFPADPSKVQGLWLDIQSAEAEGFETENPTKADLERLGLDKPGLKLTVQPMSETVAGSEPSSSAAQKPPIRVSFSAPKPDGTVYAHRDDITAVMKIGKTNYEKLDQVIGDFSSYREHRAAPVDRWKLSMIELTGTAGVVKLFKNEEDSSWHRDSPGGVTVPPEQANALIDAIEAIKASGYIDGPAAVQSISGGETPLGISIQEGTGDSARTVWMKIHAPGAGSQADSTQRRVTSSAASSIYLVPVAAVQTLIDQSTAIAHPPAQTAGTPTAQTEETKKQ